MCTGERRAARRIRVVVTTTGVVLAAVAMLHAPSASAQSLTLGDVYRQLGRANPRLSAAHALARAAEARTTADTRPPDPQVQLGLMNYALPSFAPMEAVGMVQLQVMQMVPLGGKLALAGEAAKARARAESARASEVAWDVRREAAMAFYDTWSSDRSLDVARESLRLLLDVSRTAEAMYRVGEGRQADVLRAQVEIARMAEDTLRMQAMRAGSAAQLDALLDRATSRQVGVPLRPDFPDDLPPLDSLQDEAQRSRPMLLGGTEDVRAASAMARLARRELLPDLQVGVQLAQRGNGAGGTERMGSLMLGATVPVFARSRQLRMREETLAMQAMAEAELSAMRAESRALVSRAHADLTRARNLATLYRLTVIPLAEATASSAQAAYRTGGVDFMTLLDNRMLVNRYRQELIAIEADEGRSWAELEMLLGRQLIDPDAVHRAAPGNGGAP